MPWARRWKDGPPQAKFYIHPVLNSAGFRPGAFNGLGCSKEPWIAHLNRPRGADGALPNPRQTLALHPHAIFLLRGCDPIHPPTAAAALLPGPMSQPRPRPRSRPGRRRRRLPELGVNADDDDPRAAMADPKQQQPPAGDGRPLPSSTSSSPAVHGTHLISSAPQSPPLRARYLNFIL
jgi:hypothetical protein